MRIRTDTIPEFVIALTEREARCLAYGCEHVVDIKKDLFSGRVDSWEVMREVATKLITKIKETTE